MTSSPGSHFQRRHGRVQRGGAGSDCQRVLRLHAGGVLVLEDRDLRLIERVGEAEGLAAPQDFRELRLFLVVVIERTPIGGPERLGADRGAAVDGQLRRGCRRGRRSPRRLWPERLCGPWGDLLLLRFSLRFSTARASVPISRFQAWSREKVRLRQTGPGPPNRRTPSEIHRGRPGVSSGTARRRPSSIAYARSLYIRFTAKFGR